jgi:archaellum component FlaC
MKPDTIKRVVEQLERVEKLKRDVSRFEGRMEGILLSLKELGCDSIEYAERHLKNLQEEMEDVAQELEKLSEEFDSKYQDKLESL